MRAPALSRFQKWALTDATPEMVVNRRSQSRRIDWTSQARGANCKAEFSFAAQTEAEYDRSNRLALYGGHYLDRVGVLACAQSVAASISDRKNIRPAGGCQRW